jgi:hypothetical protein
MYSGLNDYTAARCLMLNVHLKHNVAKKKHRCMKQEYSSVELIMISLLSSIKIRVSVIFM